MKTALIQKPVIKQLYSLNSNTDHLLHILALSHSELLEQIKAMSLNNPFVEVSKDFDDQFWQQQSSAISLNEELVRQLSMIRDEPALPAARYLADCLDEHGFYTRSIEEEARLAGMSLDLFKKGLSVLQSLDPAGVAARSSMDAIALQLKRKKQLQAAWIVENCQDLLLEQDLAAISRRMNCPQQAISQYMDQIRRCTPFPCANYDTGPVLSRLPEVRVTVEEKRIHIEPAALPAIGISEMDQKLTGDLKRYFQQARFFIDAIHRRNQTVMIAANALMTFQEPYLVYGTEKNPCTLRDLSQMTGLAISTLSRTLKGKYYELDGQIYPFYSLLDSSTKKGSSKSAVVKGIFMLIEKEDPAQPLMDEEISVLLEDLELYASRRTVAKYRKEAGIPGSRQRKTAKLKKEN